MMAAATGPFSRGTSTAKSKSPTGIIHRPKTGKTATVLVDKMTIQKSNHYDFEYYSNAPYVDGVTGALWKSTISNSNGDKINVDRDVAGILHYELCLLVTQSSTFDNIDSQASRRFEGQLQRKYEAYWAIHPSAESPVTYNISPEIDRSQDIDYGNTNINIT